MAEAQAAALVMNNPQVLELLLQLPQAHQLANLLSSGTISAQDLVKLLQQFGVDVNSLLGQNENNSKHEQQPVPKIGKGRKRGRKSKVDSQDVDRKNSTGKASGSNKLGVSSPVMDGAKFGLPSPGLVNLGDISGIAGLEKFSHMPSLRNNGLSNSEGQDSNVNLQNLQNQTSIQSDTTKMMLQQLGINPDQLSTQDASLLEQILGGNGGQLDATTQMLLLQSLQTMQQPGMINQQGTDLNESLKDVKTPTIQDMDKLLRANSPRKKFGGHNSDQMSDFQRMAELMEPPSKKTKQAMSRSITPNDTDKLNEKMLQEKRQSMENLNMLNTLNQQNALNQQHALNKQNQQNQQNVQNALHNAQNALQHQTSIDPAILKMLEASNPGQITPEILQLLSQPNCLDKLQKLAENEKPVKPDISSIKISLVSKLNGKRLSGDQAPMLKDLPEFLKACPEFHVAQDSKQLVLDCPEISGNNFVKERLEEPTQNEITLNQMMAQSGVDLDQLKSLGIDTSTLLAGMTGSASLDVNVGLGNGLNNSSVNGNNVLGNSSMLNSNGLHNGLNNGLNSNGPNNGFNNILQNTGLSGKQTTQSINVKPVLEQDKAMQSLLGNLDPGTLAMLGTMDAATLATLGLDNKSLQILTNQTNQMNNQLAAQNNQLAAQAQLAAQLTQNPLAGAGATNDMQALLQMASMMGAGGNSGTLNNMQQLSRTPSTQRKRGRPKKDRAKERELERARLQQNAAVAEQASMMANQNLTQELLAQAMMSQNPLLALGGNLGGNLGGMNNDALLAQALMVSQATPTTSNSNLVTEKLLSNSAMLTAQLGGAGGADMANLLAAMNGGATDEMTQQLLNSLAGGMSMPTTTIDNLSNINQSLQLPQQSSSRAVTGG